MNTRYGVIFAIGLLVSLFLSLTLSKAHAHDVANLGVHLENETVALLWVNPAFAAIDVGETITLQLELANVTDLQGIALDVVFDPALVQVVDADGGTPGIQILPGGCPSPDFVIKNDADNAVGLIEYDVAALAPSPPCSGSAVVASVAFKGLAPGSSGIQFQNWLLSDPDGFLIQVTTQDGQLDVSYIIWNTWIYLPVIVHDP